MKLQNYVMATHLATGLLTGTAIVVAAVLEVTLGSMIFAGCIGCVAGMLLAFQLNSQLAQWMDVLERMTTSGDGSQFRTVGIHDLDSVGDRIRQVVQRWTEAAANSREQAKEVERLLQHIDRRSGGTARRGRHAAETLRNQLGSISSSATAELNQLLACTQDIERHAREISVGAEDQSDAVSKTTTYVEQMSNNIDSVAKNASAAQRAAVTTRDSASAALKLVRELIDGMSRIRTHVEASESKLRSLGDHSHEIGSIVETISNISSRTDMLALNASIESVRAGEHGRGFAVVAEEVRKLAEQAAQATREVAGLIDSIQLKTRESIALMAEERSEVEAEVSRVNAAGEALERISQISSESATQVGEITDATQLQLQLTQDVVLAMERIANVAKASRVRAEEACWTTNTLTKVAQRFDSSLSPLRDCGWSETAGEAGHAPVRATFPTSIEINSPSGFGPAAAEFSNQ